MLARLLVALRSKKGFFGALVLFGYAAYGVVAVLGNAETVADNLGDTLQFLATGPGVLSAVSVGVLLILWALVTQSPETDSSPQAATTRDAVESKEVERLNTKLAEKDQRIDELEQQLAANRPPQHFNTPVEVIETPTPAKAKEIEQLESKNKQLQEQLQRAALEVGLPPNVATERRIAHCDFHINDLLRLAGKGFIIEGKDFVHCTIRGPGVISTFEDVRPPEQKPENTSAGSGYDPRTLTVKGEPELVLHEIQSDSDSVSGVIYLVGCTYKNVTFEGIGIAGSSEEIKFWRENAKFEGRGSVGMPGSEVRWEVVREEDGDG